MPAPIDRRLRAWLDGGGSLSRRIAAAFADFRVERLTQRTGPATPAEWRALGARGACRRVHVREVLLWGDGRPLVLARSVLPAAQAGLAWRAVRGLGARPLADLLFVDRTVRRRALGRVRLSPLATRRRLARAGSEAARAWPPGGNWGRRALFTRRGVPLLLSEWFSAALAQRAPDRRGGAAPAAGRGPAGAQCPPPR
jgi:chorismate--pyruvate lyase